MISLPLTDQLKRLRLSGILDTFDVRLAQARENALCHDEWLSLILQDEIARRESQVLAERLKKAKFEQEKTFETFDRHRYTPQVQSTIQDLMTGRYLNDHGHIFVVGPTGTGKSHLAQALGHQACRQGKRVRFIRASVFLREMQTSRADHSWERALKRFTQPELLILDDFGLSTLTFSQAEDVYELIAERHLTSSLITSNRKIDALVDLFPDTAMGNAVMDRLGSKSYHLILEGDSYRRYFNPKTQGQKQEEKIMS